MSKPKVTLACRDERARRGVSYESRHSPSAVADGTCPKCGHEPFHVQGANQRIASDDRAYESDARCVACKAFVGVLRQETETLFGLREDEAMSRLGIRIY